MGAASTSEKKKWLKEVACALQYIHSKGLVHLAIQPSSVLIDSERIAKISDFSLCSGLPAVGVRHKTINFASPEQIRRNVQSSKSDNWSFGMTMYFLLTGKVPFDKLAKKFPDEKHFLYQISKKKVRPYIEEGFEDQYMDLSCSMRDIWRDDAGHRKSLKSIVEEL